MHARRQGDRQGPLALDARLRARPRDGRHMRLIATRRLEPGTQLSRDVMDGRPGAIPLLRAGVKLTERHRTALLAAGVNAIYVDDELGEGIEVRQAVDPETRRRATEAVSRAFD